MLKKVCLFLLMSFMVMPMAFAGSQMPAGPVMTGESVMIEEVAPGELTEMPDKSYIDPYANAVNFHVTVESPYSPAQLVIMADYSFGGADGDRQTIVNKMNKLYADTQEKVGRYGKVVRTSFSVYDNGVVYDNGGMPTEKRNFGGYMNVRVTLDVVRQYDLVRGILEELGYNGVYLDSNIAIEEQIKAESAVADKMRGLIEMKREVYEKVLGYELGKVVGLNISTWADGYRYDSVNNILPLMVSANGYFGMKK